MLSGSNSNPSYTGRADIYSARVPTPPRIVIPPPPLNSDALPIINIGASTVLPPAATGSLAYQNLVTANNQIEWVYEYRRSAQPILPYLYLGPMTMAKDAAWLSAQGITMALGVKQKHSFQNKVMDGALRKAGEAGIEVRAVEVRDNPGLIQEFPGAAAAINEHLLRVLAATGQLGKVLVFCESGNDRSAGVLAAYLMETHSDVDYIKAMQLCQAQRFCVNFDDNMKRLLQGYWDILCAKRTVGNTEDAAVNGRAGVQGANGGTPSKGKRGFEREDDVQMDGMNGDDVERFAGRTFVPFIDIPLEDRMVDEGMFHDE